jgi:hypothetical protein
MGKMLAALAFVLVVSSTNAAAQPAQYVRLSLNDGRTVDGQITGGDAINYFVQTPHGYFSILRTNVVAVTPLQPYPTAAPPPPPPPPMTGAPESQSSNSIVMNHGFRTAAGTYLLTAIIALSRTKEDDDAKLGFIPIAGPILWTTKNDEDGFLKDGWDYLALGSTIGQVGGVFLMMTNKGSSNRGIISVAPTASQHYGGLSVAGMW